MKILAVIDMQKDFIDGSLGTGEAVSILPKVAEKIARFDGMVVYTRDTHDENYSDTLEGRKLPVRHCIRNTDGWRLAPEIEELRKAGNSPVFDKETFGSMELAKFLRTYAAEHALQEELTEVEFVGLCTDICVITNALLVRTVLPQTEISVDASCCAGVTPESHKNALEAMKMCQITIKE